MGFSSILVAATVCSAQAQPDSSIRVTKAGVVLSARTLQRRLSFASQRLQTSSLTVDGRQLLSRPAEEFKFQVLYADPDQAPKLLKPGEGGSIDTMAVDASTNVLSVQEHSERVESKVTWHSDPSESLSVCSNKLEHTDRDGVHRLDVTEVLCDGSIVVSLHYEVYDDFPAVRKWLEVKNVGTHWLKIDRLVLDDLDFAAPYRHETPLTPSERGAVSSLIAMSSADQRNGVILGNEIPSALRSISYSGALGYADDYFEWVLGPKESFQSEPVFEYGFSGDVFRTASAQSKPLDRAVETTFQNFLRERIGLQVDAAHLPAPYFSTWSNFGPNINDVILREQARLAAEAGFGAVVIDQGWQRGLLGTQVDSTKFPHFSETTRYIQSLGLRVGLWVSTFRSPDSIDLRDIPDAASRPSIYRDGGLGMAFASPWRDYYANDLVRLSTLYGATYFKQDFSNIRFGDLAEGHESRTAKESLLRGLRGLLEAQDRVRKANPNLTLELTHEVYWGTPGVPCDLAALKHANLYHIPPNDYSGDGDRKQRYSPNWKIDRTATQRDLLDGTLHARERFYAHRGLPLDAIEYYGAATMNVEGSLTAQIQDRQIASWLMGAPMVFAGDLTSLTKNNLELYRNRFALLKRLQQSYNIYDYFEFSGVPSQPTKLDWQWWGKLNPQGFGAVVILRGSGGARTRAVNIPWVVAETQYNVHSILGDQNLGQFSGQQLRAGRIQLTLPANGQEILELSPMAPPPTAREQPSVDRQRK